MKHKIEAIFEKYDIPGCLDSLECDGATSVISQVLLFEGICHSVGCGLLMTNPPGLKSIGHLWIIVTPICWIDFKATMWSDHADAPNGIFNPVDHIQFYKMSEEFTPTFQPELARILADIDFNLVEAGVK